MSIANEIDSLLIEAILVVQLNVELNLCNESFVCEKYNNQDK